jgi:hypothetical protein
MINIDNDCVQVDERTYRCRRMGEDGEQVAFGTVRFRRRTNTYEIDPEDGYPVSGPYDSLATAVAALDAHHRGILTARIARRQAQAEEALVAAEAASNANERKKWSRKAESLTKRADEARAMLSVMESH